MFACSWPISMLNGGAKACFMCTFLKQYTKQCLAVTGEGAGWPLRIARSDHNQKNQDHLLNKQVAGAR